MRKLSELPARENELDEEMQEQILFCLVLDRLYCGKGVVEEVRYSGREYFRAVVLADEAVVFCFYEKSRKILVIELHVVVGNERTSDDDRSESDVVGDDFVSFRFGVETHRATAKKSVYENTLRLFDRLKNVFDQLSLAAEVTW
jgi:hypothetical protein